MKKNEKAITLISLSITIIVLIIITGVTVFNGSKVVQQAKLEELRTNMLLIEAKAREYVEEANFKIGFETDAAEIAKIRKQVYEDGAKLTLSSGTKYKVTNETLKNWGLEKIEIKSDEEYLIEFNDKDVEVEIYNSIGYNYNNSVKHTLTELEEIE